MNESHWHKKQNHQQSPEHEGGWRADSVSQALLMQAKSNAMWNNLCRKLGLAFFPDDVQTRSSTCLRSIARQQDFLLWAVMKHNEGRHSLGPVLSGSEQSGPELMCVWCVWLHVGGKEVKRGTDAWFTTVRPPRHEREGDDYLKSHSLGGVSTSYRKKYHIVATEGLCSPSIMCFCWWIKVEGAKYPAQIYAES